MGWVQTSPVAIATNLFQESTLVHRPELNVNRLRLERSNPEPFNLPYSSPQENTFSKQLTTPTQGVLTFLDRRFTELESHQLVPGTEVVMAWSERTKRTLSERTQKLIKPLQTPFVKPENPDVSSEVSQTNALGIQALIYAAIDYFFGKRSSNLPGTGSHEPSARLVNSQGEAPQLSGRYAAPQLPGTTHPNLELANNSEPDPWLTWGDLFGRPDASDNAQNAKVQFPNHHTQAQLPEAFNIKVPIRPRNSVWRVLKSYLSFKQPPRQPSTPRLGEPMVKRSESIVESAKLMKGKGGRSRPTHVSPKGTVSTTLKTRSSGAVSSRSQSVSPAKPETTSLTTSASKTNLEPAHDWIETSATPSGYVKHPLERVLESVDRAMLWLEELAVKVWRWVQQLGRRG
ncbi:MAG TPA: hypothetical protein DCE56_10580 [Cyanobacteria bacterium UBA8553]|nr:hypothetical protein [Cyanobacteria bacterium UBA8553]